MANVTGITANGKRVRLIESYSVDGEKLHRVRWYDKELEQFVVAELPIKLVTIISINGIAVGTNCAESRT